MTIEFPTESWKDYALIDCGDGQKLERFGNVVMSRPEPKALWTPSMPAYEWSKMAWTNFRPGAGFGKAGKEDTGTWQMLRQMDEQWYIRYAGGGSGEPAGGADGSQARTAGPAGSPRFSLRLGLTAFKHVGVFPEQAPNWEYIYSQVRRLVEGAAPDSADNPKGKSAGIPRPKVLNLFAYTGAASLAAACAGAEVTHLDSVRQVVNWASGNASASRLEGLHWVVEDAMKFARREAKRGHRYQGIILDPPAYGHGPDGEKWKLDECLFEMLRTVNEILEPRDSFMVLNLYSNGYSPLLGETVVREAFDLGAAPGDPGKKQNGSQTPYSLESGELALRDSFGKALPLSIFVRLAR